MKNKTTAAILAILFGGFGAHKFYLRDGGGGIFYIMLTMFSISLRFPIGWILAWIDALSLFTMSEETFNKRYNNRPITHQRRRDNRRSGRNPYESPRQQQRTTRRSRGQQAPSRAKRIIRDNPFKTSGLKRLKDFEFDLAETDLNKALELSPDDAEIHMGLAKVYSLEEKTAKSYHHISKALALGYKGKEEVQQADEFAYIRVQESYDEFASSGFLTVPAQERAKIKKNTKTGTTAVNPPKDDLLQNDLLLSQLNKLQELRNKGLLSESEFQQEKVKLMGR